MNSARAISARFDRHLRRLQKPFLKHERGGGLIKRLAATLMLIGLPCLGGCKAYQFGSPSMHRQDIQTVHVQMFESDSFRRYLGQRLTEMVAKEIELNTPFRITSADLAQSFVRGRIVRDTKRVLGESINDDPRDIQIGLRVEVTWVDRTGVPLMQRQVLRIDDDVNFIPEGGQSMMTAQQELINDIARQIVNQMEAPW